MQMKMLADAIRREIVAQGGVLPFVRFMELALYCPKLGYYETKKDSVGRRGDFYTSVSVGGLFGRLLAFQFAQWLEGLKSLGATVKIVEAGAHDGRLAKDILTWLQANRPDLFAHMEYVIIEPSTARQEWQRQTLETFAEKVRWVHDIGTLTIQNFSPLTSQGLTGIIFSNELLDAFPVRRLGWDTRQKKWFEWGVAAAGEKFVWAKMEDRDASFLSFNLPAALLEILPDNFTTEINPAAEAWWRHAAGCLRHGKLLTVDYGLASDDFFQPSRKQGTLRAFSQHHFADDVLAHPGEQDLTAHVNFSAIQKVGEQAGLKTDSFSTQEKFLAQILESTLKDKSFGEWNSTLARQFQTLTHPEHLGRTFSVLVQSR
jgi:SAM-dependent MidA family methyltransferase